MVAKIVIHVLVENLLLVLSKEVFGPLYCKCICQLSNQVLYCNLFQYADDASLMKVVGTNE